MQLYSDSDCPVLIFACWVLSLLWSCLHCSGLTCSFNFGWKATSVGRCWTAMPLNCCVQDHYSFRLFSRNLVHCPCWHIRSFCFGQPAIRLFRFTVSPVQIHWFLSASDLCFSFEFVVQVHFQAAAPVLHSEVSRCSNSLVFFYWSRSFCQ